MWQLIRLMHKKRARMYSRSIFFIYRHNTHRVELKTFNFIPNRVITTNIIHRSIGHFRVPPGLCIKTRLSAQPLIWNWFFILMQIKLIFKRKVVHLDSFWKLRFLPITTHDSYTCTAPTINSKWTDEDTVNEWQSLCKLIKLKLYVCRNFNFCNSVTNDKYCN